MPPISRIYKGSELVYEAPDVRSFTQASFPVLSVGDRIELFRASNVRNAPTINAQTLKGVNPRGVRGTVRGGPQPGPSGRSWYDINFDVGHDGWVVNDNYAGIASTAAVQTTPSYFRTGDPIRLFRRANVRSTAGISNNLVRVADAQSRGTIAQGPTRIGTANWYRIDFESGTDGWVVSDNYVLVPRPSTGGGSFPAFAGSGNKPGTGNTGPRTNPATFRRMGSMTITQDNFVLENVIITGMIDIRAKNVTVRNFIMDWSSPKAGGFYGFRIDNKNASNAIIEDGEIKGVLNAFYGSNYTARRLYLHDLGIDAFKAITNVVIESNYAHRLGTEVGSHADAVQTTGANNVVIRYNNFDLPPTPGFSNSAALMLQDEFFPLTNVLVENNWMNGGAYTVRVNHKPVSWAAPSNIRIVNNKMGRDALYGEILVTVSPRVGIVCSGNVWEDTGELLAKQC